MSDLHKKRVQEQAARNLADKPATLAAYQERVRKQQSKWAYAKTVENLSNGGILIPKKEALLGGLDELADTARKRKPGRPRKTP